MRYKIRKLYVYLNPFLSTHSSSDRIQYQERQLREQRMADKYLAVVSRFPLDDYDSFSQLCVDFCSMIDLNILELSYCEHSLSLSPKTRFPAIPLEGEVAEHVKVWENGISKLTFYDPPVRIGDLNLRVGVWKDNTRLIDCYQLVKTCPECGGDIVSDKCFGLATIGWQIINKFDQHYCLIGTRGRLVKGAVDRFVKE